MAFVKISIVKCMKRRLSYNCRLSNTGYERAIFLEMPQVACCGSPIDMRSPNKGFVIRTINCNAIVRHSNSYIKVNAAGTRERIFDFTKKRVLRFGVSADPNHQLFVIFRRLIRKALVTFETYSGLNSSELRRHFLRTAE